MNLLERYVFGPVDAVRPWLLLRGLLLLLAFDCWLDLVPHGGRYGFGDFNVAHFALLDRLLPSPTPGTYVATVLLTGLLAFVLALSRPTRLGVAGVCALYSYGWLMSMLDSYQHHYLLTLLLLSATFFPMLSSEEVFAGTALDRSRGWGGALFAFGLLELLLGVSGVDSPLSALLTEGAAVETPGWLWALRVGTLLLGGLLAFLPDRQANVEPQPPTASKKRKATKRKRSRSTERRSEATAPTTSHSGPNSPPTVSAWAFTSFCITCAIVYFYTAVTKLSDDWREGHALRRLARTDLLEALRVQALGEGLPVFGVMTADAFWKLLATGAILVQIVTCAGYLLGPAIDRLWPQWRPWQRVAFIVIALGAPLSFHVAAEAGLGLDIGWFSFYMMFVAVAVFAPASALRTMAFLPTSPWRVLRTRLRRLDARRLRLVVVAVLVLASSLAVASASSLDLPGSLGVGLISTTALLIASAWAFRRGRPSLAGGWGAGLALGLATMTLAIVHSDVRFDFYRFVGGEYRRHGEIARALRAYEKANAYVNAPFCLYRGTGRRAELVECYSQEERAESIAARHPGLNVRRRDRRAQEAEMRRRLEEQGSHER